MAAEVAVSEKKPGSLDTLSKEELVQKCKSLLQLAHKAKNAKDDKQKQYDAIQAESEKEKEELQNKISLLESKNEDIEDLLKSKQRKIDRLSDENDSFLGQVDTLCSQINDLKKERAEGETDLQKVQGELNKLKTDFKKAIDDSYETQKELKEENKKVNEDLSKVVKQLNTSKSNEAKLNQELSTEKERRLKLEAQASKGREAEASLICIKETERKLGERLKQAEEAQAMERKLALDKNSQLISISDSLILAQTQLQEKQHIIEELQVKLVQVSEVKDKGEMVITKKEDKPAVEETLKMGLDDMIGRHETLDKHMKGLEAENDSLKCNIEEIKTEMAGKCKEIDILLEDHKTTLKEKKDTEQKNMGLIEELNQLNEQMKKRGERIDKLEQLHLEQEVKIRDIEKIRHDLESSKNVAEDELKRTVNSIEEFRNMNRIETEKLREKIKHSLVKETSLIKEGEEKGDEIVSLKSQMSGMSDLINLYKSEISTLNIKVGEMQDSLDEEKARCVEIELELSKHIELNKSSGTLLTDYVIKTEEVSKEVSNDELKEPQEMLLNRDEDIKCLNIEIDSLKSTIESMTKEKDCYINKYTADISNLEEQILFKTKDSKEKDDKIEALKAEHTKLNLILEEEIKGHTDSQEKISRKVDHLELLLSAEQRKVVDLEFNSEANKIEIDTLISNANVMTTRLDESYKESEQLRSELTTLVQDYTNAKENLTLTEAKYEEVKYTLSSKEEELTLSMRRNEELGEEISSLKNVTTSQVAASDNDDVRSEVMSSSTVSKVEEYNRMKDVEDSFEDRYSKLKLIAIKLKKKCGEQAKQIQELELRRTRMDELEVNGSIGNCNGSKEKLASLTKNFELLQGEYDSVVDKLETCHQQMKQQGKDLEASLAECLAAKQKSEEAEQLNLVTKTELARLEDKVRETEASLRVLQVTEEEERKERIALEEKTKEQDDLVNQLKDRVSAGFILEETVVSLKLQISQLEENLAREKERADAAREGMSATRLQLVQAEADLVKIKSEQDEAVKKWEESVRMGEVLQEQLAEMVQDNKKQIGGERTKVVQLERQVSVLETTGRTTAHQLLLKEAEVDRLGKEFESYKLRAQSVLKQSKDRQVEQEAQKKQEELFAMEKLNDALNDKVKSLSSEVRTIAMEKRGLQEEHERLMERQSLLLQELATKEKNWRERSERQETKVRQAEVERAGAGERMERSLETLRQGHEQELQLQRSAHSKEITRMQQLLDTSENEVIRLELVLQKEQESRRQAEELVGTRGAFDNSLDISQIEREAAEGQEVDPNQHQTMVTGSSVTSPLPLEQLLAQTEAYSELTAEGLRSGNSSRIGGAEKQVTHLAALLSESEAQNGRLEKLTEVLKEEIRTYQRSEERHKHIENLEYVKNVILKFLTLTGTQEKARLIPVLRTILKLKKEEVEKIEELVKVEDETAGRDSDGWGGYLGLWSTGP